MTVVAWDGTTLAADKMTSFGGLHGTTTKVHRIGEVLVAGCGTTALIQEMLRWVEGGCDPEKFPSQQRDSKESVSLLVVRKDGPLHQYETTPWPLVLHNEQWAIGSGRDFAMAAMYLGKTAREAVEIASVLCCDCGNGVDELTHNPGVTNYGRDNAIRGAKSGQQSRKGRGVPRNRPPGGNAGAAEARPWWDADDERE